MAAAASRPQPNSPNEVFVKSAKRSEGEVEEVPPRCFVVLHAVACRGRILLFRFS